MFRVSFVYCPPPTQNIFVLVVSYCTEKLRDRVAYAAATVPLQLFSWGQRTLTRSAAVSRGTEGEFLFGVERDKLDQTLRGRRIAQIKQKGIEEGAVRPSLFSWSPQTSSKVYVGLIQNPTVGNVGK